MSVIVHKAAQAGNLAALSPEDRARYERQAERQLRSAREATARGLWDAANVPRVYQGAELGNLSHLRTVPDGYVERSRHLAGMLTRPQAETFAVLGGWRTGKTELACGLIKSFCRAGRSARYVKCLHLFADIVSTRSPAARETLSGLIARYRRFDLLVLDEITARTDSAFDALIFRDLIDERHNAVKKTLLMGNLQKSELSEYLGGAVVARLNESGGVIDIPWGKLDFLPRAIKA